MTARERSKVEEKLAQIMSELISDHGDLFEADLIYLNRNDKLNCQNCIKQEHKNVWGIKTDGSVADGAATVRKDKIYGHIFGPRCRTWLQDWSAKLAKYNKALDDSLACLQVPNDNSAAKPCTTSISSNSKKNHIAKTVPDVISLVVETEGITRNAAIAKYVLPYLCGPPAKQIVKLVSVICTICFLKAGLFDLIKTFCIDYISIYIC